MGWQQGSDCAEQPQAGMRRVARMLHLATGAHPTKIKVGKKLHRKKKYLGGF